MEKEIIKWAKNQEEISTLLLTGSRTTPSTVDRLSDYDIAVFVDKPISSLTTDDWLKEISPFWVCIHEKVILEKETYPSRLVIFDQGIKVDFIFFPTILLKQWISHKALPDLFNAGYRVLLDKTNLTSQLPAATLQAFLTQKPTSHEFDLLVKEFWFECYHVAKYLHRNDLWVVKFRDADIKHRLLLKMIAWHEAAKHNWTLSIDPTGKRMKDWVSPEIWKEAHQIFSHFDSNDSWTALLNTIELFQRLAKETAKLLHFPYLTTLDDQMTLYIQKLKS